jgi:hypothetical protein
MERRNTSLAKKRQQQEIVNEKVPVGLVMRHPLDHIQNGWEAKNYWICFLIGYSYWICQKLQCMARPVSAGLKRFTTSRHWI